MRVIYPGHRYELDHLDGDGKSILQFVQRRPHHSPMEGVINQEVVRALIDRVKALEAEVHWEGNAQILYHLRMVIVLHEMRALSRHVEKYAFAVENIGVGRDGHFSFAPVPLSPRTKETK